MRSLAVLVITLVCNGVHADIVFLGFNSDGNDSFAIGLTTSYPSSTVFRFRDDEWNGSAFNDSAEGQFSFTNTNLLPEGTILKFTSTGTKTVVDGNGTSVLGTLSSGSIDLANSDEAIYAYFGSDFDTVTTQLASLRTDDAGAVLFGNSVDFDGTASQDGDVIAYTGSTSIVGVMSDFVALTSNTSNWTLQGDGVGDQSGMYAPPMGTLSAVPEPGAMTFGALICCLLGFAAVAKRLRGK
jgi:hypothetical protein